MIKTLILISIVMVISLTSVTAFAIPQKISVSGRIVSSATNLPLSNSNASFVLKVLNPNSTDCVLYSEIVGPKDMTNSDGAFDINLGEGITTYPTSLPVHVLDAFNNSGALTCENGASYIPDPNDERVLRVSFFDGVGWQDFSPDTVFTSVPYAGLASSAEKLGTNVATDFLLKVGLPICAAGTFLTWNGNSFACSSVSGAYGGTVTSVSSSSSYLTIANNTSTPTLSINVGDTAGTLAAGNDSRLTGALQAGSLASGDLSGAYPNPVVTKIQGSAVSEVAPSASGQVLRWDGGSSYLPAFLTLSDIRSSVSAASSIFPTTSCTASQTLSWSSLTDTMTCVTISVSSVSGVLLAANGGTGQSAYAVGDTLYASGADSLSRLPASASGTVLTSNGAGIAPSWQDPARPVTNINITTANGFVIADAASGAYYTFNGTAAGTAYLPPLSGLPNGWQVTITRQVAQILRVAPVGVDKFPGGRTYFEMQGQNMASVTITKLGSSWNLTNKTEDCIVGADCWTTNATGGMKSVFAGTYNGHQYFTTPGGCATNVATPTCNGSADTLLMAWASAAPESNNPIISNPSAIDGQVQSLIISSYTTASAARYCESLNYAGYTDWYLPARQELALLYQNSVSIGGFNYADGYWSSTEYGATMAWPFGFFGGALSGGITKTSAFRVRCVRKF